MEQRTFTRLALVAGGLLVAATAAAEPLTVDRAVQIALQHSSDMVNARAGVLTAQGGLYSAYSGMLPSISAEYSRSGSWTKMNRGEQIFGSTLFPSVRNDRENYSTTPQLTASWTVLNLSSTAAMRGAQSSLKAARQRQAAAGNDLVLNTKRQFYEVVKAIHLADVNNGALKLSRDSERRVTAMFQVGSVSRSDLLKAQVQTAQSVLDSLTAAQAVTVQRILLSEQIGIAEPDLGEVDTTLNVEPRSYDEAALLAEASRNRPDIAAAESDLRAAQSGLRAANFARLPYVTLQGSAAFQLRSNFKQTAYDSLKAGVLMPLDEPAVEAAGSRTDREYGASVAINLNLFSGFAIEGKIAEARASMLQARERRDVLRRNLASEVHQAMLDYGAAVESDRVATSAIDSANENLKLTQQKYNVGSATILDLIDAQVQLQRAQSQGVTAKAAIRVAEATLERVRGAGAP